MNKVLIGNNLEIIKQLSDNSVNCVVTSPPYFGLRSYLDKSDPDKIHEIGLEQTPQEYIAKLVELFREIKRILRPEGTVWLNLADSYAGSWGNAGGKKRGSGSQREINCGSLVKNHVAMYGEFVPPAKYGFKDLAIKPKDLCGIPWRVAFALQEEGWFLRQDIIWAKKHCMPESVKDRCVKSHEYVFLLTKSPKYFFDYIAIREETTTTTTKNRLSQNVSAQNGSDRVPGKTNGNIKAAGDFAYRNKRSVWRVAPQPYKGSHFATFSYALVEPMILAGCPETCCKECGSPYIRKEKIVGKQITQQMLDSGADKDGNYTGQATKDFSSGKAQNASDTKRRILESMSKIREYEFVKNCSCETTETKPGVVLDPFLGSGTTAWVAKCLDRDYIGIELNKEYLPLIEERIQQPKPEKKKKKVKKEPNAPKQLSLLEFLE